MMYHFCTYFDHNYLYRGLALYRSLEVHCPKFTLWVLPMSEQAETTLKRLKLPHVRLIRLQDLEDTALREVKPGRTAVEYMWTLTPSLPLYVLKKDPAIKLIAYVDADCFFYANPTPLYDELGRRSILLIEHRYSPDRKSWEKTSGRFNVELMMFRRDARGLEALHWWRDRCIEWCFHRYEDGKLGDQMYLNDWPTRFRGVHILQHKGGGLAPWNIGNYQLAERNGQIFVNDEPLIFYHFHALKLFSLTDYEPSSGYKFTPQQQHLIYAPYLAVLKQTARDVRAVDSSFQAGFAERPTLGQRLRTAAGRLTKRWR